MRDDQRLQDPLGFSAMSEADIERVIRDERVGFLEIADILDRLFREVGLKGVRTIQDVPLSQLSGFRTSWTYFTNEAPVTKTVGEHLEMVSGYIRRELEEAFGETGSPEGDAKIAAAWLKAVLRLPVLDIIAMKEDPEKPNEAVTGDWKPRPNERPSKSETLELEGGFKVKMERLGFDGDPSEAQGLAFAGFRARLFDPSGQPVSYARINVIRKRRRDDELSPGDFTYDMDIPDDELARLGVRLMEIVTSPEELFEHGDLVSVQHIVTSPAQRRKGYARRLLVGVLKDMKRRYKGIGTLVVPLFAENMLVTPSQNAPPELRLLYLSATALARRMFSDSQISREAFGPFGETLCFDEGANLNDAEMFMERYESARET